MGCCAGSALVHERVDAGSRQQAAATRHQYIDPSSLVQILRTKQVRLLKAKFILEWIEGGCGPLPCRQDLPEEAFVDVDALDEQQLVSLIIIAISYCWISQDHPDPDCYHLQTLGSLLRCFLSSSFDSAPDKITVNATGAWCIKAKLQRDGANFGAGDGRCVGVFLDWTGLFQDKPKGRRTSEENEVFDHALKTINIWYAHVTTIVWMFTSLPADVQRKDYRDSGWTTFEAAVASILTKGTDMLEITAEARQNLLTSDNCRHSYIQLSHDLMSRQSRVPALPDEFDSMIDGKVFTNGADKEKVVKPKYAKTFYDLIPSLPAIQYSGLGLTPDNVYKILDLATMHIKYLETLDLSCNQGINLPIHSFAQLPSLTTLDLAVTKVSGDIGALESLVNLKHLALTETQVSGDIAALRPLAHLTILDMSNTQVKGDIRAVQNMVELTDLRLYNTQVEGDIQAVQNMVELTDLRLYNTQVTGDIKAVEPLLKLTHLEINDTKVTGKIQSLQPLVKLTWLNLDGTQISGDIQVVQTLVHLTMLGLKDTQASGDIVAMRPLVNLTFLNLKRTQVSGDIQAVRRPGLTLVAP